MVEEALFAERVLSLPWASRRVDLGASAKREPTSVIVCGDYVLDETLYVEAGYKKLLPPKW